MGEKTLLKRATLITENAEYRPDKNIYISGGRIEKITDAKTDTGNPTGYDCVDCSKYYVSSGLPNLHAHVAMNIFKGIAEDVEADEWFNGLIFPYESNMTDEDVYLGAKLGIAEMINNGVTVVADHYFGEEQVLKAAMDMNFRMDIAPTIFGSTPNYKERLEEVKHFIRSHRNDSELISFRIGPHADYTCPPDTLLEMADTAHSMKLPMHIHLCDDNAQNPLSFERYNKAPAVILKEAGLLEDRVLLGHGLWIGDETLPLFNENCYFGFCPKTYMKMSLGKGNFYSHYKTLQFGFGTDGAASSNGLNIVEQARLFALSGKFEEVATEYPVGFVWKHMIGGHDAFTFGTGKMNEGAPADLVIWDLDSPDTFPIYDPVTAILYSSNSGNVRYTMINGRFLKYDGRLNFDYKELKSESVEAIRRLLNRGKGKATVSYLK